MYILLLSDTCCSNDRNKETGLARANLSDIKIHVKHTFYIDSLVTGAHKYLP